MKNKTDFFIGLALLVFCCVMAHQIYLIPESASKDVFTAESFPIGITAALALLSLVLMGRAAFGREAGSCWPEKALFTKIALMGAWILAYVVGFVFLGEYAYDMEWPEGTGFVISTLIFISGAQFLVGYRNPFRTGLVAAGISAFLYVVFAIFFKVPLP